MRDAQFNEWITVSEKEDQEMIRLERTPANFSHMLNAASWERESGPSRAPHKELRHDPDQNEAQFQAAWMRVQWQLHIFISVDIQRYVSNRCFTWRKELKAGGYSSYHEWYKWNWAGDKEERSEFKTIIVKVSRQPTDIVVESNRPKTIISVMDKDSLVCVSSKPILLYSFLI